MNEKIKSALENQFQKHRLVFWYDASGDMLKYFEELELEGVKKEQIANNEFGLKIKVLVREPKQKFLIYQPSSCPSPESNWLLDLNLAHTLFDTNKISLYLQEMNLGREYYELVQEHADFFSSAKRMKEFRNQVISGDSQDQFRLKLFAVLCEVNPEWEEIFRTLTEKILEGTYDYWLEQATRFNLNGYLWEVLTKKFGYQSSQPTFKDFLYTWLRDTFNKTLPNQTGKMTQDAFVLFTHWKNNEETRELLQKLSEKASKDLGMEDEISRMAPLELLNGDGFDSIERTVLSALRDGILNDKLNDDQVNVWVKCREKKLFFKKYEDIYLGLKEGSNFLNLLRRSDYKSKSFKEGVENYVNRTYSVDTLYRKYIAATEKAEHRDIFASLSDKIERAYANSWLLTQNNSWQEILDKQNAWNAEQWSSQRNFWDTEVKSYAEKGKRVFVIISDGLRFESGKDLSFRIVREDRYDCEVDFRITGLPCFTQLGMASLLPHQKLSFSGKDQYIFADGISTQGTQNRTKILQLAHSRSVAITAEDFLNMNAHKEGREYIKDFDVIYIYSNQIDKAGDEKTTESKVFKATEDEFDQVIKLLKHIANMNGTNTLITADHGYLYQHNPLDESDFIAYESGGEVYKDNRRFVIGKNLRMESGVMKFSSPQLNLEGDTEIIIPKGMGRFRQRGSGSRYVHGGASLQEIIVPVIRVNKKRKSDVALVEVEILQSGTNITSNQYGLAFFQKDSVSDKRSPRSLRAGFYSKDDKLISDQVMLTFDVRDSDNAGREKRHRFIFKQEASSFNGQDVFLKLEEQVEGTSQFRLYKSLTYQMRISFGAEFNDF